MAIHPSIVTIPSLPSSATSRLADRVEAYGMCKEGRKWDIPAFGKDETIAHEWYVANLAKKEQQSPRRGKNNHKAEEYYIYVLSFHCRDSV